MKPWYKNVELRREVQEGRSFSPDEFAIALEQVVSGTAPEDYRDPTQFFSRTCVTRALSEHAGMVIRRLSGRTENTAPVLTLITQFGGGKTHTLTALYHLANEGSGAATLPGISALLTDAGVSEVPTARPGVFVGNAWDPAEGRETPWIDLARQLAGDRGVAALGPAAKTTPPGTEALGKVFAAAGAPVLLLFDEVLNFVNRHRGMAESFHAFLQNLTVAVTGTTHAAAVISLPRSQVEMTDWDQKWQDRITKVVRRVAQDLIANDESEISEVVRRRLFEDLGDERVRRKVARTFADWCFERSARLPPEWLAVDTTKTGAKSQEFLRRRFEACYPFHPSTLSVFQRKWRALAQFQQTRGALAMLAQWISWAASEDFKKARKEPLITLGSAPLHVPEFRSVVLGQLGETRLDVAIEADIAGETTHAGALDADAKGALSDIHRRVGTTILFESSGGQVDKVAHLPELRFALGSPDIDTASIDSAASKLETSGFFTRRVGADGYRIHHQATLKKVVSDRRASLDEKKEVRPAIRKLVQNEFESGANLPLLFFPEEGAAVPDAPRLTLVVLDPEMEWTDDGPVRKRIGEWTKARGASPRLCPGTLVWCAKKPGRELRNRVETWLAWRRVEQEVAEGVLGTEYDRADRRGLAAQARDAEEDAKEEARASYRFVAVADRQVEFGLRTIDLGAGHASASATLCGRVVRILKSEDLLNESVGAGYFDRHWPPAFKESEAWPLASLRQNFLNGALTRLTDTDAILRRQIVDFVLEGDFGLASGKKSDGGFERFWFREMVRPEEVEFESDVYLLKRDKAEAFSAPPDASAAWQESTLGRETQPKAPEDPGIEPAPEPGPGSDPSAGATTLRLVGTVPREVWMQLGNKVLPELDSGDDLCVRIDLSARFGSGRAGGMEAELRQALEDLGLSGQVRVERVPAPGAPDGK